jgi:lipopolysaccharide/colanic/teichoic acid biosynthesis glycosyltransferase
LRHDVNQLRTDIGSLESKGVLRFSLRSILSHRRTQFVTAVILAAVLPWAIRGFLLPSQLLEGPSTDTLLANIFAVALGFWIRLSIETHPGIRRAFVILPSASTAHGIVLMWFILTRQPYDRVALVAGYIIHVAWLYTLFVTELRTRRRIAIVPFGRFEPLRKIREVDWLVLSRARLHDTRGCQAIVADFAAELPEEWEAFLAEAALAGRIVYQVKQLSESLTGRVELEHLSENSFGSLVPSRGYFYLKSLGDLAFALIVLPIALPVMGLIALTVRIDSKGPSLFRQLRMGHAGKHITVYKFRTMRNAPIDDERIAAITNDDDARITRIGHFLRKFRLDELPQILNILKGEMSWIGPRPEAEALSRWYQSEIPFYRYRHVVKPGISGWAQVNQGHVAEVEQVHRKLQFDFYYVKYFSPWLDLLILVRTIRTVCSGFGAR